MKPCAYQVLLWSALAVAPAMGCNVRVENGWIATPVAAARTWAAYGTLVNGGKTNASIVAASASLAARVELHQSTVENGVAKMRPVPRLELAPAARVELQPGGKHLMLIDPVAKVTVGDRVTISLKEAGGCIIAGQFVVGARAAAASVSDKAGMAMDHGNQPAGDMAGHQHH
jgi:hypothetical protein